MKTNWKLTLKRKQPEIFLALGLVAGGVAMGGVAYASMKLPGRVEELQKNLDLVEQNLAKNSVNYTEEDAKNDRQLMQVHAGLQIARSYLPAITLSMVSLGCILKSHDLQKKNIMALGAAYAAVETSFRAYRERVATKYGEDAEYAIRYDLEEISIQETVIDENGKEKKKKVKQNVITHDLISPYAKIFDAFNANYEDDPSQNMMFLKSVHLKANDQLKTQGYMFLNDVYDMLGFPKTRAGQNVGWLYRPGESGDRDNYIDLGVFTTHRERAVDFVNGYESVIVLDFNVDGDILNDPKFLIEEI